MSETPPTDQGRTTPELKEWEIHVTPWEGTFLAKVNRARTHIRLAAPFIKLGVIRLLLASLQRSAATPPIQVDVLTRLKLTDCLSGVNDLSASYLLSDNAIPEVCSIDLRFDNLLHAKLYIFDDVETVVTSSNLTHAGLLHNREIALSTRRPDIVRSTTVYFDELFHNALPATQGALDAMALQLSKCDPLPLVDLDYPSDSVIANAANIDFDSDELGSDASGISEPLTESGNESAEAYATSMLKSAGGSTNEPVHEPIMSSSRDDYQCIKVDSGADTSETRERLTAVSFLDDASIAAMDATLKRMLENNLLRHFRVLDANGGGFSCSDHPVVNELLGVVSERFHKVFGDPKPSDAALAMIYTHESAHDALGVSSVDRDYALLSETIGFFVLGVVIARIVFDDVTSTTTCDALESKASYICGSRHHVAQLNGRGLICAISGKALSAFSGTPLEAVEEITNSVARRLVGYLYHTRDWRTCTNILRNLLQIHDTFPLESYRHEDAMFSLQEMAQLRYGVPPKYERVDGKSADGKVTVIVSVTNGKKTNELAAGTGYTEKCAKTDAANRAIENLRLGRPTERRQDRSLLRIPSWLRDKCRGEGCSILREMSGKRIAEDYYQAVLIPIPKLDGKNQGRRMECERLRGLLCNLGSRVRRLLTLEECAMNSPAWEETELRMRSMIDPLPSWAYRLPSAYDKHEQRKQDTRRRHAECIRILATPLGRWLNDLSQHAMFDEVLSHRPVRQTLDAFLGALFVTHGIDACRPVIAALRMPMRPSD